jgi:hypothetical protein
MFSRSLMPWWQRLRKCIKIGHKNRLKKRKLAL